MKKIAIGCGAILVVFAISMVIGLVWLFSIPEGGVKLRNEMDAYALDYLKDHQILMPGEDLIAYYDATLNMNGTEAVILTTKRLIYHKDGRNEAVELANIDDIEHREESFIGDVFEVHPFSGQPMKIEVPLFNNGDTFRSALMRAWNKSREGNAEGSSERESSDSLERQTSPYEETNN